MGHLIRYIEVGEKAVRYLVMANIEEDARRNGDGYQSKMTWHDNIPPFATKKEAEAFIEKYDGSYDDHAVRFYDYSGATKTAKIEEYETKVVELLKGLREYKNEHSVHTFKANHIGCPKCGSKLNKEYLSGEHCPLCRTDLRSKTTLDKIKWFEEKIADYRKRIETEKMKQRKNVKIKWLVKYEFHC